MPYTSPKSLPYVPADIAITYAPADDPFMIAAREYAHTQSKGCTHRVGAVLVRDGRLIASGANCIEQSARPAFCVRDVLSIPSGQGYDLCANCAGNHCEPSTIANAHMRGEPTNGATLYLYGHWWCCESCCNALAAAGVRDVRLVKGATELFEKPEWKIPTWPQTVHVRMISDNDVDSAILQSLQTAFARANITVVPQEYSSGPIVFDLALSSDKITLDGMIEHYADAPLLLKYLALRLPQLIREKSYSRDPAAEPQGKS